MLMARDWFGDGEIFVVDIPLACCALESQSAAGARPEVDTEAIPDGARTQLEAAKFLGGVAAGTALGWKALGNARGDTTNHTTNNYAGGAE